MKPERLLIIPEYDNMEESIGLSKEYGLGFEFNDFFFPKIITSKEEVEKRIKFYNGYEGMPEYRTSHGAFYDVTIHSDDPDIKRISAERIDESLRIGQALGVKGLVFHTNHIPNFFTDFYINNWVTRNVEFFRKMTVKYPDINIYMENMFDLDATLLEAIGKEMTDVPNFGICFDYSHAQVFGDENKLKDWIIRISPYVKHVHINDHDNRCDYHWAVGDGVTNWKQFKDYYNQYFYDSSVLIEVNGYDKQKRSLEYLLEV